MNIIEDDFILKSVDNRFDLYFFKKVTKKESGDTKLEPYIAAYGCTLSSAINRIIKHRVNTKYASETPYLLEYLASLESMYKEMLKLLKEDE